MNHTPTPQKQTPRNLGEGERADIMAALENIIMDTPGRKRPIEKARAYLNGLLMDIRYSDPEEEARIKTACNAHEDLVKACKEAIGFIEHSSGDKYPENLIELLQQALAKAEGKS